MAPEKPPKMIAHSRSTSKAKNKTKTKSVRRLLEPPPPLASNSGKICVIINMLATVNLAYKMKIVK
jgi:hypothetical protein